MPALFAGLVVDCEPDPAVGEVDVAGVWLVTGGEVLVRGVVPFPVVAWAKAMVAVNKPNANNERICFMTVPPEARSGPCAPTRFL